MEIYICPAGLVKSEWQRDKDMLRELWWYR